jgi:potassium-dependent mechanosensitive channel
MWALSIRKTTLAILLICLSYGQAFAAEPQNQFAQKVASWERTIESISARIKTGRTGTIEERELRARLQAVADEAVGERDKSLKRTKQVAALLATLGAKSDKGPEPTAIREQRKTLETERTAYQGYTKQASLFVAKAEQMLGDIGIRSRQRLKTLLLDRGLTPLSYSAWAIALPEAGHLMRVSLFDAVKNWWIDIKIATGQQGPLVRNLVIALLISLAGWALGRWLRRKFGRVDAVDQPSYARRLFAGLVEGLGRTLGPIVFIVLASSSALDTGVISGPLATVIWAVSRGLVLFLFGYALINAALTPRRQQWRLLNFDSDASRLLVVRLKLTLGIFLTFEAMYRSVSWATMSVELESVSALVFTLFMSPLLISLLGRRIWNSHSLDGDDVSENHRTTVSRLRTVLTFGLSLLPVVAALGYAGLASYTVKSIVMTGLVVGGLTLLRTIARETVAAGLDNEHRFGRAIQSALALNPEATANVLFWLRIVLDLALLIVAGLALLPVWGFSAEETALSAAKLMRGVQIGSYTLSLFDIAVALLLFATIVSLTRLIQRWLDHHLLPTLSQDKGVRDALKTGVGYMGIVIAALVGISVLGLNLTNLALVAGALSVGIGFGLQNVVNNFVSGLILLIERPIKAGDWVVIGGNEGTVKKVNVRSTEIETFQRASVIIPNADLIANPVTNWTHKNILGRAEVRIGVAYGTDPRLVEEILLECANAHSNVISYPKAFVLFMDFGDSALIFELRAYLEDVQKRLGTASDLRFAIDTTLREKGIEIPFPQRVIHFVDRGSTENRSLEGDDS